VGEDGFSVGNHASLQMHYCTTSLVMLLLASMEFLMGKLMQFPKSSKIASTFAGMPVVLKFFD
jgi:hypothetical protein